MPLSGMQVGFFMDGFKKLLLRLGLTQEKLKWLTYPFSLIYAGLTGFSASVIRSLLQKLLAQHGVKGLDNFALTVLVLFYRHAQLFPDCRRSLVLRLCFYLDHDQQRRGGA